MSENKYVIISWHTCISLCVCVHIYKMKPWKELKGTVEILGNKYIYVNIFIHTQLYNIYTLYIDLYLINIHTRRKFIFYINTNMCNYIYIHVYTYICICVSIHFISPDIHI